MAPSQAASEVLNYLRPLRVLGRLVPSSTATATHPSTTHWSLSGALGASRSAGLAASAAVMDSPKQTLVQWGLSSLPEMVKWHTCLLRVGREREGGTSFKSSPLAAGDGDLASLSPLRRCTPTPTSRQPLKLREGLCDSSDSKMSLSVAKNVAQGGKPAT